MKRLIPAILAAILLATIPCARTQEANPVEQRLREGLRNTMLQLRDAQNQVATAQALQVESERKIKELEARLDALNKQAVADRNTSANMIAELKTRVEEQTTVNQAYLVALAKWKKSYGEVTKLAAQKEAERAKFEAKSIHLERTVQEQQVKNIQMYKLGMEIVDRYEKFGLGDALLAREPFVGSTRVKFQNLMQDYADKLTDQRIKP